MRFHPMPILPCGKEPLRYRAVSTASRPEVARRVSARTRIFSDFLVVARTCSTAATRRASSMLHYKQSTNAGWELKPRLVGTNENKEFWEKRMLAGIGSIGVE